jgi:PadR family transcriptional regulator, regulatory protein AphA
MALIHGDALKQDQKTMPLEHAILAFLDFSPMSGYDLKKFFDQSVAHFWSATQSHIYKSLEGSEQKGWVEAKIVPQEGKPNRKVYAITDAGRQELRRWLTSPLPLEPVREGWLIQVFFAHSLANEEIAALFEQRVQEIENRLQAYKGPAQAAIEQNAEMIGLERAKELWQITLDYGVAYYEFELEWNRRMAARARRLPPLSPPPASPEKTAVP